ncbi:MAG: hypothetical protein PF485_12250 [Bacteroidales bacterium]|jgi:tetratricopeptide (TPR) repeat protein|nr:hypothetical protein [Bacteroidales bacterium]
MESKFDLIERYLMNDMSVREEVEFEELLKNNPELMREFVLRKEIDCAINEDDILNLRDNLDSIINEKSAFPIKFKRSFLYYTVATVVILFILVISIKILPLRNQEITEVFQSYYTPYPAIVSFRSSVDRNEIEEILHEAFNYYDEEKYELASVCFRKVLHVDNTNNMSQFYLSICEIEKNNLQVASTFLNDLIIKKDHVFWEQSSWYLALVYLKQNELNKAENLFRKVVQENMARKADAEVILKYLN